jgi:hypothetical protein
MALCGARILENEANAKEHAETAPGRAAIWRRSRPGGLLLIATILATIEQQTARGGF